MSMKTMNTSAIEVAGEIVVAFLNRGTIDASQLAPLVREVHAALLAGNATPHTAVAVNDAVADSAPPLPEVPSRGEAPRAAPMAIEDTISPEHLICLEDGKPYRTLKRLLRGRYGLSPAEYRAKWGLPNDYPMVAPDLAAHRSEIAKTMGLGGRTKPVRRAAS